MAELGGVGDDLLPFQNSKQFVLKEVVSIFFFFLETNTHTQRGSK